MSTRTREQGVIVDVMYGKEDHGILTCVVSVEFEGSRQGFGLLAFPNKEVGDDFVADLCKTFGVKRYKLLVGKECYALRCFDTWNEPIEALEAEDGARFVLTEWRRKREPDVLDPLAQRVRDLLGEIDMYKRRINDKVAALESVKERYHPVSSKRTKAKV